MRWSCLEEPAVVYSVQHRNCENVRMKNITVSIDEETYRRARIKAAEEGTSVSALVRSFLHSLNQGQDALSRFERLRRLQEKTLADIRSRGGGLSSADNVSRDSLHERDALR